MKLLKDLELDFEKPLWSLNPEFALIDTILERHPEIYEMVSQDIIGKSKNSKKGRHDRPSVE